MRLQQAQFRRAIKRKKAQEKKNVDFDKVKDHVNGLPEPDDEQKIIKRPPAVYSNTTPFGIAKELHQKKPEW